MLDKHERILVLRNGVFFKPKEAPHRRYAPEFKKQVVEATREEKPRYRETARRFELGSHKSVATWQTSGSASDIGAGQVAFHLKRAEVRGLICLYNRRPLISLMRERIILQLQLTTPGKVSMTVCRKTSISSAEAATAWTCSLSFPVTR